jgi:hypothetical protein
MKTVRVLFGNKIQRINNYTKNEYCLQLASINKHTFTRASKNRIFYGMIQTKKIYFISSSFSLRIVKSSISKQCRVNWCMSQMDRQ